jgi:hypothetical protein
MGEMDYETLLIWFKYIVTARLPEENSQVINGFKSYQFTISTDVI